MPRAEAKYRITAEDRTERGLRSAGARLQRFSRRALTAVGAAVASIGAGITAWGNAVSRSQDRLVELNREAAELNSTLEEAAAINLGAEILGTSPGEIRDLYETVAERIDEAAQGSKDVRENFARFGIDPETLRGLGAIATVARLSEQFRSLPRQQALSASSALFGEGRGRILGQDVIGAFGTAGQLGLLDGVQRLVKEAEDGARARAELEAIALRRWDQLINSEAFTALVRFATAAIQSTDPVGTLRGVEQSGSFSVGRQSVDAQLRAARAMDGAAEALERGTARYERR